VTLDFSPSQISENAAVIAFRLYNSGEPVVVDIGLTNDAFLGSDDRPAISSIGQDFGFVVYDTTTAFTFVCRRSPLVTDASTYWFGSLTNRLNYNWTQVTTDSVSNVDSAFSVSWQGVALGTGESATRSLIAKFGTYDADILTIFLDLPDLPGPVYYKNTIEIPGTAQSSNPGDLLGVILLVDGNVDQVRKVQEPIYPAGAQFHLEFIPAEFQIPEGEHEVEFFAVNSEGSVSSPQALKLTVVEPTASATASPLATPTPLATLSGTRPADAPSPSDSSLSGKAVFLGISIGGGLLVVVIVVGLVVFCCWRKRHSKFQSLPFMGSSKELNEELTNDAAERLI
jgi:hypothetical protein